MTEWAQDGYVEKHVNVVERYISKIGLDRQVANIIRGFVERSPVGTPITMIEFGCGTGPISRALSNIPIISRFVGIDADFDMIEKYKATGDHTKFLGFVADLRNPIPINAEATIATAINTWYAMTYSSIKLSIEKALVVRYKGLENIARQVKPGGTFVVSEPVCKEGKLTSQMQAKFIVHEFAERFKLGREKNIFQGLLAVAGGVLELVGSDTREIRAANKDLLENTHTFESAEAMAKFIQQTGYFKVVNIIEGAYGGLNALLVLERTDLPVPVIADP